MPVALRQRRQVRLSPCVSTGKRRSTCCLSPMHGRNGAQFGWPRAARVGTARSGCLCAMQVGRSVRCREAAHACCLASAQTGTLGRRLASAQANGSGLLPCANAWQERRSIRLASRGASRNGAVWLSLRDAGRSLCAMQGGSSCLLPCIRADRYARAAPCVSAGERHRLAALRQCMAGTALNSAGPAPSAGCARTGTLRGRTLDLLPCVRAGGCARRSHCAAQARGLCRPFSDFMQEEVLG